MKLRIATYNVHNTDGAKSLVGIANEIKGIGADFVGLQELDIGVHRSKGKNTLSEINKICAYPSAVFAKTIDYDGGDYGIGALYSYPLVSMQKYLLPSTGEQRVIVQLVLETEQGNISFYNTHLSLEKNVREEQFQFISLLLKKEERLILTGDFNIDSFDEFSPINNIKCANCPDRSITTFKTGGCIDNIVISNNMRFENVFLSESEYSDHNMLVADIIL